MDKRRPIQADIEARSDIAASAASEGGVAPEQFREALARWAATVTLVAARDDDGDIHATTATSFAPVSADPPLVVVGLGASAQVLPYATEGRRVGVSLLEERQSSWATIFADSFPVRRPQWTEDEPPRLPGATASLSCTVVGVHEPGGGSRVVVLRVDDAEVGEGERPLLYWQRGYRRLDEE